MKIILIRHGLTYGNIRKEYSGWTDTMLTQKGKDQLREKTEKGLYPEVEMIYTSPLTRCIDSLKICYPNSKYKTINNLKEINFGDWEGKTHEELEDDSLYQKWLNDYKNVDFPDGESLSQFRSRVLTAIGEIKMDMKRNHYDNAAVFCHGGVIRTLANEYQQSDEFIIVKNGEGYIVDFDNKSLEKFGENSG